MKTIKITNPILTNKKDGYKFEVENINYWISKEVLKDHGVDENELEGKVIELDEEKTKILRSGTKNWVFLSSWTIIKILKNADEIQNADKKNKMEVKQRNSLKEAEIFVEDTIIKPIVTKNEKIDFDTIYKQVDFYEIKADDDKMSKNEKLIQKSIKLSKVKYNNGLPTSADYQFSEMQSLCDEDLSLLVQGKIKKIKIKKMEEIKLPKSVQGDNKQIVRLLSGKYSSFMTKTDNEDFINEKLATADFIEKIKRRADTKFVNIQRVVKKAKELHRETGVNPFVLAWPFLKGKTVFGSAIHCPIAYRNVNVEESLNEYSIEVDELFTINTYPILKGYVDNKTQVNDIQHQLGSLKDVLIEFFKHGIKITKPNIDELHNFSKWSDEESLKYTSGMFEMTNEVIFKNKPSDEFVYYDLKKIINKFGEFDLPESTYSNIKRRDVSTTRSYITDVDHSKALVIEQALNSSVVIYGPPGTGKSETITNLIGQLINEGKSSLLVTEKATAIEVIESNLRKIQMDDFVLNLNNTSKIDFAKKFNKLDTLIYSYEYDTEFKPLQKIDFAKKWFEDNKDIAGFIKMFDDKNIELSCIGDYIDFSKVVTSNFKKNQIEQNEVLAFLKSNVENYENVNSQKDTIKLLKDDLEIKLERQTILEGELSDLKNSMKDAKSSFPEEAHKLLLETRENVSMQVIIKNIDDLIRMCEFSNLDELVTWSLGKKPLFIGKYKKDNRASLQELIAIGERAKKLKSIYQNQLSNLELRINETKQKLFELKEKISFSKKEIQDFEKLEKATNLKMLEVFGDKASLYDWEIVKFICLNDSILNEDIDKKWKEHIKKRDKFTETIRNSIKQNYAIKMRERLNGIDFRNKYNNIKKYVNNKLDKRGQTVEKVVGTGFEIIKYMFPSLMMNPDLVSAIIPQNPNIFDYVIFDEASQMRLHRAFPSLHRGKIAVVAGDDKQLGPTDLFSDIGSEEDNDLRIDEDTSLENETILNYAKDSYLGVHLQTHYRSKAKDLISFSNKTFYSNTIMVADSQNPRYDGDTPIIVEEINGIWDRESYTNIQEATRVVELVKHYRLQGKTVGVITFNDSQTKLISESLVETVPGDLLLPDDFFAKPIKNVQGDERDVIIFSLTYGKYRDSNQYTSSFGNFSKEKINVAITRSKFRMHVLKSIPSSAIKIENDEKRIFKEWLEFLESYKKVDHNFKNYENKFRSKFEEDFFKQVQDLVPENVIPLANYDSGSKEIDLVLWDESQKKFVGAIELDGTQFHSQMDQVLKDYERQLFLENMGWRFKRITFWEFYKNRGECAKNALEHFNVFV